MRRTLAALAVALLVLAVPASAIAEDDPSSTTVPPTTATTAPTTTSTTSTTSTTVPVTTTTTVAAPAESAAVAPRAVPRRPSYVYRWPAVQRWWNATRVRQINNSEAVYLTRYFNAVTRAQIRAYLLAVERGRLVERWSGVARCESGGNWAINTGNGYYGGLQFNLGTWRAYGGPGMPHQQPAWMQATIADRVRVGSQGLGAWPHCGRYYG